METNRLAQRRDFVTAFATGRWQLTELCERYGVSRPTAYKWLDRWARDGDAGLVEQSRAPRSCPHRVSPKVEGWLVEARQKYGWGASKLLHVLRPRHPQAAWPSRSTINAVLDRHGLLRKRRRHPRRAPGLGAPALASTAPNQIWPADFKGQFKTGDGRYCFPLTVTDHCSRAILCCQALVATTTALARPVFVALFRDLGLPDAIRTDNGVPFASTGLHGLSALNVWWMQLGITHQRIRRGHPQANGTHERMHRELKRETLPAARHARAQQDRFDAFRRRYNEERPHEALDYRTPATLWRPSPRPYPERLPAPDYPAAFELRRVCKGAIKWRGRPVFVSHVLDGHTIGFEPVEDGLWNVVYYRTVLGRFDERTNTISEG
jgi:transposase InsO family protein